MEFLCPCLCDGVVVRAAGGVLAEKTCGEEPANEATGGEATGAEAIGPHAVVRVAIQSVLRAEEAWNRGDIEAFMEFYWKSDNLTFSSGGKTTRGWQATLDNYKERYPTREKMGQVSFTMWRSRRWAKKRRWCWAEWQLDRESEPVGGNFTLVFRKIDDRWRDRARSHFAVGGVGMGVGESCPYSKATRGNIEVGLKANGKVVASGGRN